MNREIRITAKDLDKLKALVAEEREFGKNKEAKSLKNLESELNRAIVVASVDIPRDIITMNSKFTLINLETGEAETYSLVYPEESDLIENKISILAPVGTAMLGYQEGDIIDWEIPDGSVRFKIEKILFQPEAEGQYDL
ncbi:nucleoside diphosphate kinase regulator [Fusibacter tunisiensis]|uniref:Regulator of nucleoside diphosphate kinase n=1 Tax=Fusibacter tunisiensis TaxID=1008308 RepID=A0ABS2MTB3_9FIRM|nr:nucleoside diphosphate kinase regulator [Fusibacter tunisiensis]MBM7562678.1 regulator of nucleoside diphosphate kinase [Fusibacter tunisiensis]